jgi:N-acetylglucosamine kinase-like BadF-type ATPase
VSPLFLGADVGGSRTRVLLSDGNQIVSEAEGPGAAVRPERALASAATITEVIRHALGKAGHRRGDVLVVGAAGAGRDPEREELRQALRAEMVAERIHVTTDVEIAIEAAFGDGAGIVLTAGTGSIAIARDPQGQLHRCGGYGWQMGDEGSGYSIGRSALGAVGRAADGRSPETALTAAILGATRSSGLDALIRWCAKAGPAEIASLAPTVLEVAARGDATAKGMVDYAARELSQLVFHLLPHFPGDDPIPVAYNGGLIAPEGQLQQLLRSKLAEDARLRPSTKPVEPALGAVRMAQRLGKA